MSPTGEREPEPEVHLKRLLRRKPRSLPYGVEEGFLRLGSSFESGVGPSCRREPVEGRPGFPQSLEELLQGDTELLAFSLLVQTAELLTVRGSHGANERSWVGVLVCKVEAVVGSRELPDSGGD